MKPAARNFAGARLRLRPGGLLLLRPPVLRKMGWRVNDQLVLQRVLGRLSLFCQPSEREWRIHRLRTRISPAYARRSFDDGLTPRTTAEFRRLGSSRWMTSTASYHVTPAGGNVYADLGFAPDEAAVLKMECGRRIDKTMTSKAPRCD